MSGAKKGLAIDLREVRLGARPVLENIKAHFPSGQFAALIGANGAGKTSLLRACMGLVPFDGQILLSGADVSRLAPPRRARKASYLPQERPIFWPFAAEALVALGLPPAQQERPGAGAAVAKAMRLAGACPLAGRPVDQLSGGERTRLHLARALAGQTSILLADEPIASLDPWHQIALMEKLRALAEQENMVILASLHDLSLAARFCHRVLVLHQGRAVADGPPDSALNPALLEKIWGMEIWPATIKGRNFLLPGALSSDRGPDRASD